MNTHKTQVYGSRDITSDSAPSKGRVMVIDDDDGIRDMCQIILEKAGYETDLKSSGDDLLKNDFNLPQLFIIDRQLAGVSGLDICRYLKRRQPTMHVPVIMISASPDIGVLSKEAGADDYIEKPFDISYFLKTINRYTKPDEEVQVFPTIH